MLHSENQTGAKRTHNSRKVPRHVAQGVLHILFTLAFVALTSHSYITDDPALRVVGGALMTLSATIRAASAFADLNVKKGFMYYVVNVPFVAGLFLFATQIH